jgi:hypothetical protein
VECRKLPPFFAATKTGAEYIFEMGEAVDKVVTMTAS